MAKLKFDRAFEVVLNPQEVITVPKDEVWSFWLHNGAELFINDSVASGTGPKTWVRTILTGGAKIKNCNKNDWVESKNTASVLVFKVVENV
jgi:hypothetical protein